MKEISGTGEKIEKVAEALTKKGIPPRTAAYAASMGYLREMKNQKRDL